MGAGVKVAMMGAVDVLLAGFAGWEEIFWEVWPISLERGGAYPRHQKGLPLVLVLCI